MFGIRSGSIRNPFGVHLDQLQTTIFRATILKVQNFSICAAVAAEAGALRATRLRTAARSRTDPERTPNGSRTDPRSSESFAISYYTEHIGGKAANRGHRHPAKPW